MKLPHTTGESLGLNFHFGPFRTPILSLNLMPRKSYFLAWNKNIRIYQYDARGMPMILCYDVQEKARGIYCFYRCWNCERKLFLFWPYLWWLQSSTYTFTNHYFCHNTWILLVIIISISLWLTRISHCVFKRLLLDHWWNEYISVKTHLLDHDSMCHIKR